MLAQKHRINRRFFNEVFSGGQYFGGQYFSGKIIKLDNITPPRFAVVSSKKNLKRAVERNRLRRRVYAAIHSLVPSIKPGFAIILFAKPDVLAMDFITLKTILTDLFKHHQLYHD
jgi:ribonuclease P protein component